VLQSLSAVSTATDAAALAGCNRSSGSRVFFTELIQKYYRSGKISKTAPELWSQFNLPLSGSGMVYCFFLLEVEVEESLRTSTPWLLAGASLCWAFLSWTICSSFFSLSREREMN